MKIGFLFNHDAGHQAFHLLPIVNAYACERPDDDIRAYVGGVAMLEAVNAGLAPGRGRVALVDLSLPPVVGAALKAVDLAAPASRLARLRLNARLFSDLDALVAPERTCLALKEPLARSGVSFIHVRHGAGDRAIGFHPSFSKFDLLLLQGEKYARRLRETGGLNGNKHAFIGYPKFDALALGAAPIRFFENNNPTVVYNPHFSPKYSSWFQMGEAVLDWFAANPDVNLIFAPHVMLFKRRFHVDPGTFNVAIRKDLSDRYSSRPNILIDLSSTRLFDMSYTLAADLYLGDISSQVMEFLSRPRPCVFLNPNRHDWREDEDFAAWRHGRVIEGIEDLGGALRGALATPDEFAAGQRAHFADTFDLTDEPSARRAARAIADFLEEKKTYRRECVQ